MTMWMDGEVATALGELATLAPVLDPPPVGDVLTRRERLEPMLTMLGARMPLAAVDRVSFSATAPDGAAVPMTWYQPSDGATPGSTVLYLHGGGMIVGSVGVYDAVIARYVAASGVPFLAVDYRLAPEHPYPTPVEDCYAALCWLTEHAEERQADPQRIAVMGDSAGGGLAAGLTLAARDRNGPALAQQILVYPMLDDRTSRPDPRLAETAVWTYEDNVTGWQALLGEAAGTSDVPSYAAPARRAELSGLPAAYVEVGTLDIFRDEDVAYAQRLLTAGVPVELHVHPGVPHGYELFAPGSSVAVRAMADRVRRITTL